MKKISSLVLMLGCAGFLLNGCSSQNGMVSNNTQQTANASDSTAVVTPPPPQPKSQDGSGIRGLATIGPSCPVEKTPPDPNCAEKPYKGTFNVSTEKGKLVKTIDSQMNGAFEIDIPAGTYVITLAGDKKLPNMAARTITVKNDKYTSIHLELDSGIR